MGRVTASRLGRGLAHAQAMACRRSAGRPWHEMRTRSRSAAGIQPAKELRKMGTGPARIVASVDGNRWDGAFAVPAAGTRGRVGMFVLAAAAGLALASGVVTGTPAAHATVATSARAAGAAHALPRFEPCPCDNPICR